MIDLHPPKILVKYILREFLQKFNKFIAIVACNSVVSKNFLVSATIMTCRVYILAYYYYRIYVFSEY